MAAVADKVKEIIVEGLGVDEEEVTPDASFVDDLGADSLDIVELVMAFEEHFGIEIPDEDAEKITRVKKRSSTSRRTPRPRSRQARGAAAGGRGRPDRRATLADCGSSGAVSRRRMPRRRAGARPTVVPVPRMVGFERASGREADVPAGSQGGTVEQASRCHRDRLVSPVAIGTLRTGGLTAGRSGSPASRTSIPAPLPLRLPAR